MTAITFTARCTSCYALLHTTGTTWTTEDGQDTCHATTTAHTPKTLDTPVQAGAHPERHSKPSIQFAHAFDTTPIPGQYVTGTQWPEKTPHKRGTFAGAYMGVRKSEWDGAPVHFFIDGHINNVPQPCFTMPVAEDA